MRREKGVGKERVKWRKERVRSVIGGGKEGEGRG